MKPPISAAARQHLKGLGHHLQPVVQCGKDGLTSAVVAAVEGALARHELIKVKISENADGDRHEIAGSLAESTASVLVDVLGRTLLLYRRHPSKPKIELPDAKSAKKKKRPGPKGDAPAK
ncbi:MAG TPA: ribosome assembly RNA-binding protein YhbY [Steroidobacteraceae bacterium]|jgi:RNA-binding protein